MCDGNADLEEEFKAAIKAADDEMKSHLDAAKESLRKAIEVSEKYGVPFEDSICFLYNGYIPKSFQDKFGELDQEVVSVLTGVYDEYGDYYPGWVHSQVC